MRSALAALRDMRAKLESYKEPIAIVGAGCRFPGGVVDLESYWRLLHDGVDAVGEVPANRWDIARWYDPQPTASGKTYSRHGGFLDDIAGFDAPFFGISAREAASMDPQQRLLLEVAWEALEHAGEIPDRLIGSRTGVYIGITTNDYARLLGQVEASAIDAYFLTGNAGNFAAGRLAYSFGFQGPCMAVDTACSSSLVAMHLACQSLRTRETDLALAGGVNLILSPEPTIAACKFGMLSRSGRCRTFDAAADGFVRSEGCAVVVLKRLSDAVKNRDRILAVIRGSAVNQDGATSGLTVPNKLAQEAVIRAALTDSGLDASAVGYVEAHGTATRLGDPIEMRGLLAALRGTQPEKAPLIVGSVKTNLGHLEAAAGIAGLLKTMLAIQHQEIPPHLHLKSHNPLLEWDDVPVTIPRVPQRWPMGQRVAGVSSFGASGTNAHIILSEAPLPAVLPRAEPQPYLLPISACTPAALRTHIMAWGEFLSRHVDADLTQLRDICFTASVCRRHHKHRLAWIADSIADLHRQIQSTIVSGAFAPPSTPLGKLASEFTRGCDLDWRALYPDGGVIRSLPAYPWQRERYWIDSLTVPHGEPKIDAAMNEPIEAWLTEQLAAILRTKVGRLDRHMPLQKMGIDSLMATELSHRVKRAFGIAIPLVAILRGQSLVELTQWISERRVAATAPSTRDSIGLASRTPLSHSQEQVWLLHQLDPSGTAFNIPMAARFTGPLDIARMEWALNEIVRRHDSLRTSFPLTDGLPQQVVSPSLIIELQRIDGAGLADDRTVIQQESLRPFDLIHGPLVRAALLRLADEQNIVLLTIHHLVFDGWSLGVLIEELIALYSGMPLPQVSLQYPAFAEMERAQSWDADLDYWKRKLEACPLGVDLPADRPRPTIKNFRGASRSIELPASVIASLHDLARSEGATLFMTLLAALDILLCRWTGQSDFAVGTVIANRERPETTRLIGCVMNFLAIRTPLTRDQTAQQVLQSVKASCLEAFEHQGCPYSRVVEALQPSRAGNRSPIYNVGLVLQNFGFWRAGEQFALGPHLRAEVEVVDSPNALLDLRLIGQELPSGLRLTCEYDTDLFEPESIAAFLDAYRAGLELLAKAPSCAVSQFPSPHQPSRRRTAQLSHAQEAWWFLDAMSRDGSLSNILFEVKLHGQLSSRMLEGTLKEIARRHEPLRTNFRMIDGRPVQIVQPTQDIQLRSVDLRNLPNNERVEALRQIVEQEGSQAIDTTREHPVRFTLVQCDTTEHHLVVVAHHLIFDAWSIGLFLRELETIYAALASGRASSLPDLAIQYADFATLERQRLSGTVLDAKLAYWKHRLSGATALDLVSGAPRAGQTFEARRHHFVIPDAVHVRLRALGKEWNTPLFDILFAGFSVLLRLLSGQDDIVVASPRANRPMPHAKEMIGLFANYILLRTQFTNHRAFKELVTGVKAMSKATYQQQDTPLKSILEALPAQPDGQPLQFGRAIFNLLTAKKLNLSIKLGDVTGDVLFDELGGLQGYGYEIALLMHRERTQLRGVLSYNAEHFDTHAIGAIANGFCQILEACASDPLADLDLIGDRVARIPHFNPRQKLVVVSSFTGLVFDDELTCWLEELGLPFRIENAPVAQLMPQLLDETSVVNRNPSAFKAFMVRLRDLGNDPGDFLRAVLQVAEQSGAPLLIHVCIHPTDDPERSDVTERLLATGLSQAQNISLVSRADLLAAYPTADPGVAYDNKSDLTSYAPSYGAALATNIVRRLHAFWAEPWKVIVVDCDQTLWKGYCGEDGAMGIEIDTPHVALQNALVAQHTAGKLICLCSRNNEDDVRDVFEQRTDMSLRQEHLVASRINWQSKSDNVRSLATELQLPLDSFIIVDDSPVECACLAGELPEATVVQLPRDPRQWPEFLHHLWPLDTRASTREDSQRTMLYRARLESERSRPPSFKLSDFLAGLDLKVCFTENSPRQFARLAQLTERTHQFNTTSVRRSARDLERLSTVGETRCLGIEVSDRYGDHGLVGAVLYSAGVDAVRVDTFVLSCRVLSRGVEHRVLQHLGDVAVNLGLPKVEIPFVANGRNRPAFDFLNQHGEKSRRATPTGFIFEFSTDEALAVTVQDAPEHKDGADTAAPSGRYIRRADPRTLKRAAVELSDMTRVAERARYRRRRPRPALENEFVAPRTDTERTLVQLCAQVLGVENVGITDDFFELGGRSLLAVQFVSQIGRTFEIDLPLTTVFGATTVAGMADIVERELRSRGLAAASSSPLIPMQRNGPHRPLFCIHGVDGEVFRFLPLSRRLGRDQPVYALQAAGLQDGQRQLDTIEDMAASYLEAIRTVQPFGPYRLAGWSSGSIVAYEICLRLQSAGEAVETLISFDGPAPIATARSQTLSEPNGFLNRRLTYVHTLLSKTPAMAGLRNADLGMALDGLIELLDHDRVSLLILYLVSAGGFPEQELPWLYSQLHALDREAQSRFVVHQINNAGLLTVTDQRIEQQVSVFKANFKAMIRYAPPVHIFPLTLFRATDRVVADVSGQDVDLTLGWSAFLQCPVTPLLVPGNHFSLLVEPHVASVADKLQDRLKAL